MQFFKKLRAIFNFKGKRAEMELTSAEIRGDKVFLHPVDDPDHTFCVSGKAIDILINPAVELTEDDFRVIDNEKFVRFQGQMKNDPEVPAEDLQKLRKPQEENELKSRKVPEQSPGSLQDTKEDAVGSVESDTNGKGKPAVKNEVSSPPDLEALPIYQPPKMRTVTMRLYPEEYEFLMSALDEKGYKKTEYLLACVAAAKKKSFETNYQKYYAQRMQRRKELRKAARQAAEGRIS